MPKFWPLTKQARNVLHICRLQRPNACFFHPPARGVRTAPAPRAPCFPLSCVALRPEEVSSSSEAARTYMPHRTGWPACLPPRAPGHGAVKRRRRTGARACTCVPRDEQPAAAARLSAGLVEIDPCSASCAAPALRCYEMCVSVVVRSGLGLCCLQLSASGVAGFMCMEER